MYFYLLLISCGLCRSIRGVFGKKCKRIHIYNKGGGFVIHPLGFDYIKYLNDEGSYGMTYDQWKDKKMRESSEKSHQCGQVKKDLSTYHRRK